MGIVGLGSSIQTGVSVQPYEGGFAIARTQIDIRQTIECVSEDLAHAQYLPQLDSGSDWDVDGWDIQPGFDEGNIFTNEGQDIDISDEDKDSYIFGAHARQDDVALDDSSSNLRDYNLDNPHDLGRFGEDLATRYLRMRGYEILDREWKNHYGEADIVAADNDCAVLVEVKTRKGSDVEPEDAVDPDKIERYRKMSLQFLIEHDQFNEVRMDVIAINVFGEGHAHLHHIVGATSWDN